MSPSSAAGIRAVFVGASEPDGPHPQRGATEYRENPLLRECLDEFVDPGVHRAPRSARRQCGGPGAADLAAADNRAKRSRALGAAAAGEPVVVAPPRCRSPRSISASMNSLHHLGSRPDTGSAGPVSGLPSADLRAAIEPESIRAGPGGLLDLDREPARYLTCALVHNEG